MTLLRNTNLSLRYKSAYWTARLQGKKKDEAVDRARRAAMEQMQRMIHQSTQSLTKHIFSNR